MMNTGVAKELGDLGHVLITLPNQLLGFFYFQTDPVVDWAGAGGFFENSAQVGASDGEMAADQR